MLCMPKPEIIFPELSAKLNLEFKMRKLVLTCKESRFFSSNKYKILIGRFLYGNIQFDRESSSKDIPLIKSIDEETNMIKEIAKRKA